MLKWTNLVAVAVGGVITAAALAPADAMPRISPVVSGPPSHVTLPRMGPDPRTFLSTPFRSRGFVNRFGAMGPRRSNLDGVPGDRKGNDPNWHPVVQAPSGPRDAGVPGGTPQPSQPSKP